MVEQQKISENKLIDIVTSDCMYLIPVAWEEKIT